MSPTLLILLAQAGASCAMMGLIWFVQLVHYPACHFVGEGGFQRYQTHHQRATSWVVGPFMLVEMAASVWLAGWPVPGIGQGWALAGLALTGLLWLVTAVCQVPLHTRLLAKAEPELVDRLVRSNWMRTVGWTLRAGLSLAMAGWYVREGMVR